MGGFSAPPPQFSTRPRKWGRLARGTERKKRFGALCHRVKNPPNYTVLNAAPKVAFSPFWGGPPKWGTVWTPPHFSAFRRKPGTGPPRPPIDVVVPTIIGMNSRQGTESLPYNIFLLSKKIFISFIVYPTRRIRTHSLEMNAVDSYTIRITMMK